MQIRAMLSIDSEGYEYYLKMAKIFGVGLYNRKNLGDSDDIYTSFLVAVGFLAPDISKRRAGKKWSVR